jgi:iron complex outermembrane receptor protein
MKKRILSVAIAAAVAVPVMLPNQVFAQATLEEITVTAQRRAEDLQSVPVAVTSFNPEELDRLGVTDPQQMADFIPNVSIGDGTGRANVGAQFSIRGVNEARISPVLDPAVGIYIDEVYYGRPITNFLRLLDVQSVEVLRGPQGTLFGKNSTGGAIVYSTIKPDVGGEMNGYVKAGFGEFSRANLRTALNIPLSDTLAARVAYAHMERDGWVDRISDGVGLGADDTDFFLGKASLSA